MFKHSNFLNKNQSGFGLLESIIGLALIVTVIGFGMIQFTNYRKSSKVGIQKTQMLVFKNYMISKTAYIDDCINSLALTNSDLRTMINSKSGELILNGPDGKTIGSNSVLPEFGLSIKELKVKSITLVKQAHGYSFYNGEIFFNGSLNGAVEESLGILTFLVDETGVVVACSSRDDLNNFSGFITAKNSN